MTRPVGGAAAVLLLLQAAAGCGGSGDSTGPAAVGAARLTILTRGLEPDPDGYTLQVDGMPQGAIPSNYVTVIDKLAAGSHTVTLNGLKANCAAFGGNPQQVVIVAGETTDLHITVNCTTTFVAVTVGAYHTCAISLSAMPYCWGLGDAWLGSGVGTAQPTPSPQLVSGNHTFVAMTAGLAESCGLEAGGGAYCWGLNNYGEIGDGTTTARSAPSPAFGGLAVASLSMGYSHSCALAAGGSAYCTGDNYTGQLGDGTTIGRTTPVQVVGGHTFTQISSGAAVSCGVTAGDIAYCWGDNYYGQLGDGTGVPSGTPVEVSGGIHFKMVSVGYLHTCGLAATGAAYCWGANFTGALGDASGTAQLTPVPVIGGLSFTSVSAGNGYTCGVTFFGEVYCWGSNDWGQLGDGTNTSRTRPTLMVAGGYVFAMVRAGLGAHTCAITKEALAYCWGHNSSGQLGDSTSVDYRNTPTRVVGQP